MIGMLILIGGFLMIPAVVGWTTYEQAGVKNAVAAGAATIALMVLALFMVFPGNSTDNNQTDHRQQTYDPNDGIGGFPTGP